MINGKENESGRIKKKGGTGKIKKKEVQKDKRNGENRFAKTKSARELIRPGRFFVRLLAF